MKQNIPITMTAYLMHKCGVSQFLHVTNKIIYEYGTKSNYYAE